MHPFLSLAFRAQEIGEERANGRQESTTGLVPFTTGPQESLSETNVQEPGSEPLLLFT